ncbi:11118_t:CDS:1 [Racocetra persica]|uniref:11118_t:CDS:1 n=1 Tax=Racocetra persica TaxID=160502 RepID=A0ACA9SKA9_9GLOM|nr:11118_t:CDS:1 [Racocetra persica]
MKAKMNLPDYFKNKNYEEACNGYTITVSVRDAGTDEASVTNPYFLIESVDAMNFFVRALTSKDTRVRDVIFAFAAPRL